MRRLRADQPVEVNLDGEADAIECRVSSVRGPVTTLQEPGQLAPKFQRMLTPGSLAFMVFEFGAMPVALRGVARAIPDDSAIEFIVIDGIQLAERRTAARTVLTARVLISDVGSAETDAAAAVDTSTADLSLGGALLQRRPGLSSGPEWQLEIFASGDPAPIRCRAALVRETRTHLGVAFTDMPDSDRIRLAGVLADRQRRSAP